MANHQVLMLGILSGDYAFRNSCSLNISSIFLSILFPSLDVFNEFEKHTKEDDESNRNPTNQWAGCRDSRNKLQESIDNVENIDCISQLVQQ
jgi:hypothetical protein